MLNSILHNRRLLLNERPVDIREMFSFVQKALNGLNEIKRDVKSSSMDISRLREENELLKMQISTLEKMLE